MDGTTWIKYIVTWLKIDEWMDGWMDEWTEQHMDEIYGWMNGMT